jgi:glycosyltransferase involved in cell wall biosynthesis
MQRVIDDPAERRRLSIAGRARMRERHAWDKSMQRLDGIIDRCLANYSRAGAGHPPVR